jgi:hypothetical protein
LFLNFLFFLLKYFSKELFWFKVIKFLLISFLDSTLFSLVFSISFLSSFSFLSLLESLWLWLKLLSYISFFISLFKLLK